VRGYRKAGLTLLLAVALPLAAVLPAAADFTVGSKAFPESWILAEALLSVSKSKGVENTGHRDNLGGTDIVYEALRSGMIDAYPEYTGTIAEVILKTPGETDLSAMREALAKRGIGISDPLGFNDSYALATSADVQDRLGLHTLSDLARHQGLRMALTHEFLGREDGFPGLRQHYGLQMENVRGIQHELAYGAIAEGKADIIDIYTTDAQIEHLDLRVLEDDRAFFPRYDAVWLYRLDLAEREPGAFEAMQQLVGAIDEPRMIRANARVVLEQQSYAVSADTLLMEVLGASVGPSTRGPSMLREILGNTLQHMRLVGISLALAILIGVPLGVLATRSPALAAITLASAGLLQTIPSLALLAFLIPLLGIGVLPALVALFLYSLLPIVRNTYMGISTIPPQLTESAAALGLSARTQLFRVRLPMASPSILAGIKTSAVINVGTATLAALIGAGGLGDPILSGIQLRRNDLILQGAIPAAMLALLVQWAFDLLDRVIIPRGLRLPREHS
jgi:osmoprotectant transport system permease protein